MRFCLRVVVIIMSVHVFHGQPGRTRPNLVRPKVLTSRLAHLTDAWRLHRGRHAVDDRDARPAAPS
jgi:hypothetical protein